MFTEDAPLADVAELHNLSLSTVEMYVEMVRWSFAHADDPHAKSSVAEVKRPKVSNPKLSWSEEWLDYRLGGPESNLYSSPKCLQIRNHSCSFFVATLRNPG